MKKEMLQVQQYLLFHPVFAREEKYRAAYVSLLKHICEKSKKRNQWSEGMISLMKGKLMTGEDFLPVEIDENSNVIFGDEKSGLFKYKFQKYRYNILTDCLFISAFDDKEKGRGILELVCKLFPRNGKKLAQLFECFYNADCDIIENQYSELAQIYEVIAKNRQFLAMPEKRIMITANMSAGKSTLLNALAGKKANRTQNDTCTAKIHYLYNKAGEDGFSYELDHDLELNASREVLMEDNAENTSLEIVVGTRFRSLSEIQNKVCFIDTPGVNSSQNREHRELTNGTISDDSCDLLIFLLNGENIGTDDDVKHLKYVAEQYHGEIIFLINKLDGFKRGVDSIPGTIDKVRKDLKNIGYENPRVYPISAYAAYLAKMARYGEQLTEDEMDELEFRKRKLSRDEFRYYQYYDTETPEIDENNEIEVLIRNSGILSLEKMIY